MSCHSYCQYCAARDAENADLQARLAECERDLAGMSRSVFEAITTAAFATGHGDSVLDMVNELVGQASELRAEVARLNALLEVDGEALKGKADTIAALRAQFAEAQKHAGKKRDALGRLDASPSALAQNSHPVANMSADSEAPTE